MKRLKFEILIVASGLVLFVLFQNCAGDLRFDPNLDLNAQNSAGAHPKVDFQFMLGGQSVGIGQLTQNQDYEVAYTGETVPYAEYFFSVSDFGAANCRFTPTEDPQVQRLKCIFGGTAKVTVSVQWPDGTTDTYSKTVTIGNGSGSTPTPTPGPTPIPGPTPNGAALYASNCQGCHGQLAVSSKRNRTFTQIKNAIVNQPAMMNRPGLIALTDAEIQAIADALKN